MALLNPLDALLSHELKHQIAQPALGKHGLVGCVTEHPTRAATMDVRFKHAVNQVDLEVPIHQDARAVVIRHFVPLDEMLCPFGESVNGALVNAKAFIFRGLLAL